jgi:O-antigen ligase
VLKNLFLPKIKNLSIYEWILLLFPLCQVVGSFLVNFVLILSSIIFICQSIKKNFLNQLKLNWLYFYLIFIIYTILISFFATDVLDSLRSSFFQFRYLLFSLFIFLCISDARNIGFIIKFWLVLVLLVSFDVIYQYFFLKNIFGLPIWGIRPSGVFGKELIAGAFIAYISVPIIFYYFKKFNNINLKEKILYSLIYLFLFTTVALTGERLSFLIFFVSSIIICIFNTSFKKFILLSMSLIIFFLIIYFNSSSFNARVKDFNNIIVNFYDSTYGRLWESGYLLFKQNKIFGVGLKNYRVDCDYQVDPRPESISISGQFCSSHPHNFFLEILSETGLVGFSIFFIFFFYLIFYLKNKIRYLKSDLNFKKYSSLLYGNILILLIYVWPLKTSGSFFTTWNGSFFWLNLGIALLITKGKIKN